MKLGVIADDFTGASDVANTLAKGMAPEGGLRTAQYAGVPSASASPEIEAGVVSLKSRTAPVEEAVADSLSALAWLRQQGCGQILYKYCSTFDSTPDGNIGPVAEALAQALGAQHVVFCPAFPTTGRTVYQGHLFVHDRLLNASGLENHPLTPMTDADLRRWLQHQTRHQVGHIPLPVIADGAPALRDFITAQDARFLIADAVADSDLVTLGAALAEAPLITGGSGIALGLPRNILGQGAQRAQHTRPQRFTGPEALLAGSCSGATRQQVEVHARTHPTLPIDVPGVMSGKLTADTLLTFFAQNAGRAPLAFSSAEPGEVAALQARFGASAVAAKLDGLFADTAHALIETGITRLVVAGGETSGAVAQAVTKALDCPAMTIGAEIDPGVPVLKLGAGDGVALALKSGNFGAPDFFAKALTVMEDGA
ncbi:MAG: 3-oxo-tetronate kinase [Pseudomonadota bacterium]